MEITIFGNKMRLELIILTIFIANFISLNLICTCAGGITNLFNIVMRFLSQLLTGNTETFQTNIGASELDYTTGAGVEGTYEKPTEDYNPYSHLENNVGTPKPLSEGQMDVFAGNKVSPDCCPSHYSNKDGCMCSTPEQMKYLSERGSNNKE